MKKLFIITGEHSGDMHAASIVEHLRGLYPDLEVEAVGGKKLADLGVNLFRTHEKMGKMGLSFQTLVDHIRLGKDIVNYIKNEFKPDAVLLVDYGGFNLRIAAEIKKIDIPVFYYISPQVWASRKGRIHKIRKNVSKMMLILPFEEEIHRSYGVNAQYVGNPIVHQLAVAKDRNAFCEENGLDSTKKILGICPGSRKMEIEYLVPVFIKASEILAQKYPDQIEFCLAQASSVSDELLAKNMGHHCAEVGIKILKNKNHEVLSASDALMLASGTVTLEAALYTTPMVVSYKGPFIFYLGYLLVSKVKNVSLPNIILGRKEVEELLQYKATPELIVAEIEKLLFNTEYRNNMVDALSEVKDRLSDKNAPYEAACILKDFFMSGKI